VFHSKNDHFGARATLALASCDKNLNGPDKYLWLRSVILFGIVYFVVAYAFPNPPASDPTQFLWRLASWVICILAFALQIGFEHFRLGNAPRRTALHATAAVALAAFALAAAANIHGITAGTGNQRLLAFALIIWPIIAGLPAFFVAWVAAGVLARVRSNGS